MTTTEFKIGDKVLYIGDSRKYTHTIKGFEIHPKYGKMAITSSGGDVFIIRLCKLKLK